MLLIAITGQKGSGKTTLSNLLTTKYGFLSIKFAAPLKAMLHTLLTVQGVTLDIALRMLDGDLREEPTPFLCYKTPRYAMQTLGTEWRNMIGTELWINAWERNVMDYNRVVTDDLRFKHEAEAVKRLGGIMVRIMRDNIDNEDTHISETEQTSIPVALTIHNNHDPGFMLEQLKDYLSTLDIKL